MENSIPMYLMDDNGFYYNPESPKCPWQPGSNCTWDEFIEIKIPVNLYSDGGQVAPGPNPPEWISRRGVKQI
jgi:hypothetical protein